MTEIDNPRPPTSLRVWPGIVAAVAGAVGLFLVPIVMPDRLMEGMLIGVGGGAVIALWWIFFSRAPWVDRVGGIVVMAVGVFAAKQVVHPSMANAGMGMLMPMFGIPVSGLGLVIAAAASRRLSAGLRRASTAAGILVACSAFLLVRTGGVSGSGIS